MIGHHQQYLAGNIRRSQFHTITNAHHLKNRDNPQEVTDHFKYFMKQFEQ